MYKLKYFTEEDPEKVIAFMKQYPFAIVTGTSEKYPVATHIPVNVLTDASIEKKSERTSNSLLTTHFSQLTLTGHMMKNSDHHKAFLKNENVLVIFNGPHCHVSAGLYTNPQQGSTWNYMTVHAKGKIRFGDEEYTKKMVRDLTNKYEEEESNAAFNKLPEEYVDRMVKAISGFTIEVESVENVFKLSQNRSPESRHNIIRKLRENASDDEKKIADEIEARIQMPKMTESGI